MQKIQPDLLPVLLAGALSLASATPLAAKAQNVEEVVVDGVRDENPTAPTLQTEELLRIPGTFGDPLRAIFALPGIVEASEGEGQPAVRGSGPDDNTFLIDFLPTSYVFHDFGNSLINENLIRDFGVKTAGFGPRYGQATGAVFDIALREPRIAPLSATVDMSFLQAGALVEGRISDTQAFYVSARESLIHLILKAIDDELEEEEDITIRGYPRASDYQAKYSWTPNDAHRVSVLATGASDRAAVDFGANSEEALVDPGTLGRASIDSGFNSIGVVWDADLGNSYLKSGVGYLEETRRDRLGSGAEFQDVDTSQFTFKSHYSRPLGDEHLVTVGAEHQRQDVEYSVQLRYSSCSDFDPSCDADQAPLIIEADRQKLNSTFLFVEDAWQIGKRLTLTSGVQFVHDDYLDERSVEPRVAATYAMNGDWRLNLSVGRYTQPPAVDEVVPVFGNPALQRPEATHYVAGVSGKFGDGWSLSLDTYFKDLDKLVLSVDDDRNYSNAARGEAYGAEMLLRKDSAAGWYGWLSLAWSRSEREDTLTNSVTRAGIDTPVVANLVFNKQWGDWTFGARWQYRSGMPYTAITGNRENEDFPGFYVPVYGALNAERAGPYHRLDLRAEKPFRLGRVQGSYFIDIINAYGRRNGGAVAYEPIAGGSAFRLEEEEGIPLVPSLGFKVVF